ncbi:hypothetical protein AXF42_Ash004153 [Apostasia shenzhenica]|uniref:Uncharacterized protein n=1 Tax=Apostasia shenzhenica TaxID=1088818 RepID=A0A2I0A234_9ASPA|nr:hypothetical protein AXF42_Ash004153 [Apostasia shenzhenica]
MASAAGRILSNGAALLLLLVVLLLCATDTSCDEEHFFVEDPSSAIVVELMHRALWLYNQGGRSTLPCLSFRLVSYACWMSIGDAIVWFVRFYATEFPNLRSMLAGTGSGVGVLEEALIWMDHDRDVNPQLILCPPHTTFRLPGGHV